ncbi:MULTISPECIES: thiol:disulfide interchange protein DsbG [unclassified Wenzhouxiangella]|uniref:thiol:disulfide interchange protein DsbG n=1 Tax=unclassified Wenzhouxiangella TaxID=2613841 RepID=UPI000E329807|nr:MULTISPECIES: thiol:disulfide interchange protein DsbG [unclassified Wenzhouxiangella]RFF27714.1 thiol:disulfide interchange protein DsbG [Wenzhouxiangella sp. 15181]RFP69805.1 thiol:disulfide interchange protein DsbG [Wenzhouxiangella sp. 15190]
MKIANILIISLLPGVILAGVGLSASAIAQNHPSVVQSLIDRGVTINATFDAPGDLTGYVGNKDGQAVAFYLTPDREHVVVGSMLDAEGQNLTEPKLQELVRGPQNEQAWRQLEEADWVIDGDPEAPVVVYTFTDPNCPYCHRFRQAGKPWIESGRVQLRHILVGILKEDSLPKAATIMGAESPSAALSENQDRYRDGGINVNHQLVGDNTSRVRANNQLMSSLGLGATPSTYYLDDSGNVQTKQGAPRPDELEAIMGSERPD